MSQRAVRFVVAFLVLWAAHSLVALGQDDHADGSRTRAVHLIPIYDETDEQISPYFENPLPFSSKVTCGKCHDYKTIRTGWHFNSTAPDVVRGRPGEPWILVDEKSGTQLPISYRRWPGTWHPDDVGLSPWKFTQIFGRHMPGGDAGELEQNPVDVESRWDISGRLEINCLGCHNADRLQDQSEWVIQMARENFRWGATAAGGIGVVDGIAGAVPDYYDPQLSTWPDNPWIVPPSIEYDRTKFDANKRVFFDISRKVPPNRCYFCHSTPRVEQEHWEAKTDIHLTSGMSCTDCHRNGLDHMMVRGYEEEASDYDRPAAEPFSCRGCHLGEETSEGQPPIEGRLGAPRPEHKGLPPVHFEKMTCTACHSGTWPRKEAELIRTSRANRLGIYRKAQWYTDLPYILTPVYVKQTNGKIAPHNLFWPAFWGTQEGQEISPLPLDVATAAADRILEEERVARLEAERLEALEAEGEGGEGGEGEGEGEGEAQPMVELPKIGSEEQVIKILATLGNEIQGDPVYVAGGKVYHLSPQGKLVSVEHRAARSYSWPIGHDVLPAAQSLGVNGCTDCHSENSDFYFGTVPAIGPIQFSTPPAPQYRYEFQDQDPAYLVTFGRSFRVRPLFKVVGTICAVLVGAVLVLYFFKGLDRLLKLIAKRG